MPNSETEPVSTATVMGLGTMGGRVATALAEAGITVHGYDPLPAARDRAAASGVTVHATPEPALADSTLAVLSVPMPADVLHAAETALCSLPAGSIVVDLSTIDPATALRAATLLNDHGVVYLDAPVLGRPDRCGHWTLVVGGDPDAIERVRPVLASSIAARVVRVGEVGSGSVVKLVNNLMFGAINAVTAEALNLCRLNGVDPATFVDTVADSGAATVSNLFRELGPKLVTADYDPTFALGLLQKDNRLVVELARVSGAPSFVASTVDQVNGLAANAGNAHLDSGVVYELYQALSSEQR